MIRRRPHQSNQPLSVRRAIKAQEVIAGIRSIRRKSRLNWTPARLRKLVPTVFDSSAAERGQYFALAVTVLRSWPALDREQMLTQATRRYYEKDAGRWVRRPAVLDMMREYQRRAPVDTINTGKLRAVLAGIGPEDARENFMRMLMEDLERRPVTNLRDIRFLRQLRDRHEVFSVFLEGAGEPYAQPLEIQNSHWGHWNESIAVRGPAPISPIHVPGEIVPYTPRRASTRELMKDLTVPSIVIDCPEVKELVRGEVRRHRFIPPKQRPVKRA